MPSSMQSLAFQASKPSCLIAGNSVSYSGCRNVIQAAWLAQLKEERFKGRGNNTQQEEIGSTQTGLLHAVAGTLQDNKTRAEYVQHMLPIIIAQPQSNVL
ncbi:hypothetical protein CH63R_14625 [Colletotrichum higginsianum IMI 349063]|uniref:Uncharacterized protein n=1 Tax=Colletotrichum higginsianum (strain IMI 349063) TaxID=759273 RepID=A0A1B7XQM2_COLHI|nr:hypothetical protein CH63R_14625 [Colletotrichum higginsianum IMI 349063]OBR02053.1 hypothetical protein CH63R_14625 [Colletotrichum higginsianum IMI 349063]